MLSCDGIHHLRRSRRVNFLSQERRNAEYPESKNVSRRRRPPQTLRNLEKPVL
jgi:hypothetical protein